MQSNGSALQCISRLTSFNVTERFNLPTPKGRLSVGADLDLARMDLKNNSPCVWRIRVIAIGKAPPRVR